MPKGNSKSFIAFNGIHQTILLGVEWPRNCRRHFRFIVYIDREMIETYSFTTWFDVLQHVCVVCRFLGKMPLMVGFKKNKEKGKRFNLKNTYSDNNFRILHAVFTGENCNPIFKQINPLVPSPFQKNRFFSPIFDNWLNLK